MNSIGSRIVPEHNIGGIRTLVFAPVKNVTGLPLQIISARNKIFTWASFSFLSSTWYNVFFNPQSCSYKSESLLTPNGILYKDSIQFTVAKYYSGRRFDFDEMEGIVFAVFIADSNNKGLMFGYKTPEGDYAGMKFSRKSNTGSRFSDMNFIECEFYMESYCQPFPVSGLPVTDTGIFVYEVD